DGRRSSIRCVGKDARHARNPGGLIGALRPRRPLTAAAFGSKKVSFVTFRRLATRKNLWSSNVPQGRGISGDFKDFSKRHLCARLPGPENSCVSSTVSGCQFPISVL